VIARLEMHVRERRVPGEEGRRESNSRGHHHLVPRSARFSPGLSKSRGTAEPTMAIMSLDPQHAADAGSV